jgi:hypothetical protein
MASGSVARLAGEGKPLGSNRHCGRDEAISRLTMLIGMGLRRRLAAPVMAVFLGFVF